MFILGLKSTGWVSVEGAQNFADLQGVTQTDHAKAVLWFIYVMFTAIGYAMAYVIWVATSSPTRMFRPWRTATAAK